ncbi:beta and beta-prime subunits of DNA dependent RNA-polymerase [Piromyces finnis]|uniref:DNA-directed RNA polymerase n=1 Tax=Piromyces finnis TaxID=1754191 RepID=A0A1Y1UW04_9FUNG|nr:beta and beta-prime subunits of DNA dependent RNA-polymerase [Piromyces finnis]|eukprot:ORX42246.1 beta and beta-prime subunits of DNA dependent RNA-polymerase [Piromyces finnis]
MSALVTSAKRQNFCLRSVIVPNINIPLDKPTLQTTSILSIRSFPSSSRTIQINPLIANVFQADFDGDEMNIFWLPGEESKKELASKLNIKNNFRSFKDGSLMIKFIQDTLTGLYNMTRDEHIVEPHVLENICKKLKISKKKWNSFCKYYKSRMNTDKIPYKHLISLLFPKSLTLKMGDEYLVDHGILLHTINGANQTELLNSISHYGNDFYLKFMWDVQRMVHEYNLFHIISISISDCIPDTELENKFNCILEKIPDTLSTITLSSVDSSILTSGKHVDGKLKELCLNSHYVLVKLAEALDNNLTNIINSGSKGSGDNLIQILASLGTQAILQECFIKRGYSEGLTAKELFIHSKSGRAGIISTSLNTSSTGYLQRELVKSMEDIVTDKDFIVHDSFLEYTYSMSIINK